MAMRDVIREAIEEGGATKESLVELTGTTEKGLASQFTYLRMIGTCPLKQEDGTYKIVTAEEWKEYRESHSGDTQDRLNPQERLDKCQKRKDRALVSFEKAEERKDNDPKNELLKMYFIKAEAENYIADILLDQAEDALTASEAKKDE